MDSDSKGILAIISVIVGGLVAVGLTVAVYCRSSDLIDAAAPVVESCIKHPATRPPFRRNP